MVDRAEYLGFAPVWVSETYGSDAITPLAFIAAGRSLTLAEVRKCAVV